MVLELSKRFLWAAVMIGCCANLPAQSPTEPRTAATPLTLDQAEATALKNQPRLAAAELRARSVGQQMSEARSAYRPTANFLASGAMVADTGTAVAAGALTTSSVSDRFAYGGSLAELVTDFGRTSALVGAAKSRTEAQQAMATYTRAQVRLAVRQAYYNVLGAEAVLHAANEARDNRQLVLRQVTALAQSQLRSTLDVNFAHVMESEAELAVVQAESLVQQGRAQLATVMGMQDVVETPLTEPALPTALSASPNDAVPQAIASRADLQAAKSSEAAAEEFAKAEKRLSYPSLNAVGTAGELPYRDHTLHDSYAAAGFNLSIPVFNGGLFAARQREAELEAQARAKDADAATLSVKEEARDAWYRADEAYRSLDVSDRLVAESREALRLAQARYDNALGSIVELNEAQLNETSAEITAASARYTYLRRRAELDFTAGLLN